MYKKYLFYFVWTKKVIQITFEAKATDEEISNIIKAINKNGYIVTINSLDDFNLCFKENNINYKNLQVKIEVNDSILKDIYSFSEAYIKFAPACAREIILDSNIDEMYIAILSYGYIYEDDDDYHNYRIISKVKVDENTNIEIKTISQHIMVDCTQDINEYDFKFFAYNNGYKYLFEKDEEVLEKGMETIIRLTQEINHINTIEDIKRIGG